MNSILPIYACIVFATCFGVVFRAKWHRRINRSEAWGIYALLGGFLVWTVIIVLMGREGRHVELMETVPFLWQPFVTMTLWIAAVMFFRTLRNGMRKVAEHTPDQWLVLIQALRIGAIGGIIKGVKGEIESGYVFWIGIPDLLFGLSALVVLWLLGRNAISPRQLIVWNLIGFSLILFPTFLPMSYWMNEPGFRFIFEFPMVLAPGIVVSLMISLNLLHAGILWKPLREESKEPAHKKVVPC